MVQITGLAVCFGFALHTYGSATVAKQQYPPHRSSLKTVHRTVLLTLRPSQVQVLINMEKQHIPQRVCAVCKDVAKKMPPQNSEIELNPQKVGSAAEML